MASQIRRYWERRSGAGCVCRKRNPRYCVSGFRTKVCRLWNQWRFLQAVWTEIGIIKRSRKHPLNHATIHSNNLTYTSTPIWKEVVWKKWNNPENTYCFRMNEEASSASYPWSPLGKISKRAGPIDTMPNIKITSSTAKQFAQIRLKPGFPSTK